MQRADWARRLLMRLAITRKFDEEMRGGLRDENLASTVCCDPRLLAVGRYRGMGTLIDHIRKDSASARRAVQGSEETEQLQGGTAGNEARVGPHCGDVGNVELHLRIGGMRRIRRTSSCGSTSGTAGARTGSTAGAPASSTPCTTASGTSSSASDNVLCHRDMVSAVAEHRRNIVD
jgi:hypothetical protein